MRAAVFHGAGDVRIEERPTPVPQAGEVLLRVLRSGICGSDTAEWRVGPRVFPGATPHPRTGETSPFVFGHEFVGEVVDAAGSTRFAVGDRVACGAGRSCGTCVRCAEGRTNLCLRYATYGLNLPGGLAEYVAVAETTLEPIPAGLDLDTAGLAQPLAVATHAARRAEAGAGDRVVLIGAGAIGTFVLMALARLAPDTERIVLVVDDRAAERATRFGATGTVVVDRTAEAAPAELAEAADVVIEVSGGDRRLQTALGVVRPGGRVLQLGLPLVPQSVLLHDLVLREVSLRTSLAHVCAVDLPAALALLAATPDARDLVDGVHPLDAVPDQLARVAQGGVRGKVLFAPQGA